MHFLANFFISYSLFYPALNSVPPLLVLDLLEYKYNKVVVCTQGLKSLHSSHIFTMCVALGGGG